MNKKRVIVAMSGGVDSSVAAVLLQKQGYEVIGITMKTWGFMEVGGAPKHESGCCSLDAIFDAKAVAGKFNFPHYTVDFTKAFEEAVIDDFIHEYTNGRTPNPCVVCNRKIKWEELLLKADALDAYYVATGHYANVEYNKETERFCLRNSADDKKDQTYALWGLSQSSLSRTIFPLSGLNKTQVRKLAQDFGLKTANKPDSQEICFVADNNYERFLREKIPDVISKIGEGDFILDGKKIGKHKGIPFYTIGQRRGLGISATKPLYVTRIDSSENIVELGEKKDLYKYFLFAGQVNYVSKSKLDQGEKIICKIRYSDKGSIAEVVEADQQNFVLKFDEPKSSITPGQSAVIYDELGYVLAGGVIDKSE